MKIFYADDDAEDREIFCDLVEQINPAIEVLLSKDGQEALDILNALTRLPDFIFLDINMPRLNGLECLIRLKSDDRLKAVPVVIYSTSTDSREVKRLKSLGAEEFISKGSSVEKLRTCIRDVLLKDSPVAHR